MSVRVMTAVFDHSESRLADRLVLLVIADRANDDGGGCWRGKESIARMARVSRTTVTEAITRLEGLGELRVDRRPGMTSLYWVVLPGVGQNPADLPSASRPDTGPPVGHPSGRHPATRPAAIHPEPSNDPGTDDFRSWMPASEPEPETVDTALSAMRAEIAKGRSDVKVPGTRERRDLD